MANILVIHGPNLNLLGEREPAVYGVQTLADIDQMLKDTSAQYQVEVDCFQSNHEGAIVDKIQAARGRYEALIINAGAFTHYSIAILDALRSFNGPVIEVHLSNIYQRESYRRHSLISEAATGGIFGLGAMSYKLALLAVIEMLKS